MKKQNYTHKVKIIYKNYMFWVHCPATLGGYVSPFNYA